MRLLRMVSCMKNNQWRVRERYENALRHIGTIEAKIYKLPMFKPYLQFSVFLSIFRQAINLEWFQRQKMTTDGSDGEM